MVKKMITVLLLLDFSKAFDSVDHDLLCDKTSATIQLRAISTYSDNKLPIGTSTDCTHPNGAFYGFLPIVKRNDSWTVADLPVRKPHSPFYQAHAVPHFRRRCPKFTNRFSKEIQLHVWPM